MEQEFPLRIFNTLSREIEVFRPIGKTVSFYTCGPTIYNFAHIGNFRAYVAQDVLKRYLRYKGHSVKHVMNLTDVDDKTIRDSKKQGLPLSAFTAKYREAFFQDCESLNLDPADVYPEATKYVEEMIDIISALIEKGLAYKGEDGSIYYSVSKFPGYGKLSKIPMDSLKAGARVKTDEYSKEEANDFALWKAWDEGDGDVFWESPFGRGRPGWHIECSAMAIANLGETIDIHAGGIDLVFPHHEDEIAQSEGVTGKPFANYWVHNEYLMVDGKKMSKSLGNFYTLRDVLAKGYSGREVRYLLLSTHYRSPLNFTFQALDGARGALAKLHEFILNIRQIERWGPEKESGGVQAISDISRRNFEKALDVDLGMPEALSAVFEFVKDVNRIRETLSKEDASSILDVMRDFDLVLGILGESFTLSSSDIPPEIEDLANARVLARERKNWEESDRLRNEIEKKGYLVQDTKHGQIIRICVGKY